MHKPAKVYSVNELAGELCGVLNRPLHQTIFALKTFRQLGFITYVDGGGVRLIRSEAKQLKDSPIYYAVSELQSAY